MSQPVFDAASFVAFDLDRGVINTPCNDGLALIPLNVLAALEPNETVIEFARDFGQSHGQELRRKKDSGQYGNDFGIFAEHLCGTIATLGFGRLSIELHGDALLFRLASEHVKDGCHAILNGFLSGYLEAITGKPFEVLLIRENYDLGTKMLWAGNPSAAIELESQLEKGLEPMLAIEKLSERSAS